jgi:ketosteroid isomerase-like protein
MADNDQYRLAEKMWAGIADADPAALGQTLDPKAVWQMPGESPLAGTYVGHQAIFDFMALVGELTEELESKLLDIFVSETGAVMRYSIHAQRGTEFLDTEHLFHFRAEHGVITHARFAPIDQYAYDHFFRAQ